MTSGHLECILPEYTCCSMLLAGCVRTACHMKIAFCSMKVVTHKGAESTARLTVFAILPNTFSWKDDRACRLSSWLLPPADMANRARSGTTAMDLHGINEDLGLRSCGRAFERTTHVGRSGVSPSYSECTVGQFHQAKHPPRRRLICTREAPDSETWDPCDPFVMPP